MLGLKLIPVFKKSPKYLPGHSAGTCEMPELHNLVVISYVDTGAPAGNQRVLRIAQERDFRNSMNQHMVRWPRDGKVSPYSTSEELYSTFYILLWCYTGTFYYIFENIMSGTGTVICLTQCQRTKT